ncbi:MAG TPA: magnesium/cobalt transporter CorA [Jiangellaceae bacterium]|jgi:magnesium transporter|nr:magnesium/cobalt transporter CorA [Jiangellaceae bacterium]
MGVVDWALYRDGMRESVASHHEAVRLARADGGFVWIGLHEPDESELAHIADEFALHPLAVEDAVHAHQRPKLERYGDSLFAVFKTVRYVPHAAVTETSEIVETGEVMVFLGDCFVVTVRHGEHGALKTVRARLQDDPDMLSRGPSAVLYAIADHVVDAYLEVADHLDADIDQIEDHAFSERRGRDPGLIYQVKRELLELRRAVNPLAQPLRVLAGTDLPEVDAKVREYFRDVEDHLTRVHETVAGYDELLASLLQANLAQLSITQNEDVRKITAWAAIIAVPTAIAGVYGMNFDYMPELTWKFGYPLVLAVIALTCVLLYRGFKRNGWL